MDSYEDALVESYGHYGDDIIPYCEVCENNHPYGTLCPRDKDDMPGHELMSKRMINAHWASLTEDMAKRHIAQVLYLTPPLAVIASFTELEWRAQKLYDLMFDGVIPEIEVKDKKGLLWDEGESPF